MKGSTSTCQETSLSSVSEPSSCEPAEAAAASTGPHRRSRSENDFGPTWKDTTCKKSSRRGKAVSRTDAGFWLIALELRLAIADTKNARVFLYC